MSGELYMLTPVTSPMVTRPASPDPAAGPLGIPPSALGHTPDFVPTMPANMQQTAAQPAAHDSSNLQELAPASVMLAPDAVPAVSSQTDSDSKPPVQQLAATTADVGQHHWTPVSSAAGSPFSKTRSVSTSPKRQQAEPHSSTSSSCSSPKGLAALLPEGQQQQCSWKSGLCCTCCGAGKAEGGSCSGCSHWFCKACVAPPAAAAMGAGRAGLGGPCSNCHSLCNTCKPIACSFCDERTDDATTNHSSSSIRASSSINRMCDACADTCDACKRPACAACSATFTSCSSCGYASCEECRLQAHISSGGAAAGGSEESGGCWCAPPLRTASNVRHVSSQRYQMSQLHPSVLASSMEAVGLRDADLDDFDAYNDDLDSMREEYNDHNHLMTTHNEFGVQTAHEPLQPGVASSHPGSHSTQLGATAFMAVFEGLGAHPSPTSSYSSNGLLMPGIFGNYGSPGTSIAAAAAAGESGSTSFGYCQRHQGSGVAGGRYSVVRGVASREGMVR